MATFADNFNSILSAIVIFFLMLGFAIYTPQFVLPIINSYSANDFLKAIMTATYVGILIMGLIIWPVVVLMRTRDPQQVQ